MIKYKNKKVKRQIATSIICDVCKKEYSYKNDSDIFEIQEFQHINFIGGYGSVFGDGALMKLDICQHCIKEKLGEFFIIENSEI